MARWNLFDVLVAVGGVAVLGSRDDVAVFISLLLAKTFTWAQLLIGVFGIDA